MKIIYDRGTKARLDIFLHDTYPEISRNQIQKLIKANEVTVNAKPASVHHWLKSGDTIELPDARVRAPDTQPDAHMVPTVHYKNDDFAVIIKPAGMLTHQSDRNEPNTLADWVLKKFPEVRKVGDDPARLGIVHRLDKDVSGLILIARNQDTFDYIRQLFRQRKMTKRYYCLVHGVIAKDNGEISTPIERNKTSGRMVAQSARKEGKTARTYFTVMKRYAHHTLLDIQLATGRTHQIRTHLFSIGHSIVGDNLYRTRDVKKHRKADPLDKPFLFAYAIAFTDHEKHQRIFTIPLPEPLQRLIEAL